MQNSNALLGHLSAVNEAVAGHEDSDGVNGDVLDVATHVGDLVEYLHANVATVIYALGPLACKPALRAMVRANEAAQTYRTALVRSGITKVHERHAVLTTATAVVQVMMDDIDTIMEEMDK